MGGGDIGISGGSGAGGAVADQEEGNVIGLASASRKIFHGFKNKFLDLVE